MKSISERITAGPRWPDVWPGEHYKLLTALVQVTGARSVIEIGTFTGLGSLALLQSLPADGRLTTFDIVQHDEIDGSVLTESDFASGQLRQVIADLTADPDFEANKDVLAEADFIFVDAAKDGSQERTFLRRFEQVSFRNGPLVMFDDIRVYNMLQIWRDITRPKLDLTSFGHWSGTGLVDYG